jgi:hypothetical protein
MAINEEEVERHVRETREQAAKARYPSRPTDLHGHAPRNDPRVSERDTNEPAAGAKPEPPREKKG